MNPAKLILCLWASLVSFSVYSQNCITTHPNDALECQGTFVATSEADINTYMVDLGLNSNTNKIKNLKIDFDYTGDINLFSACKLIIENNRNISATGTACLVAKEEVRIESGASLTTVADAKLYSANIVTLQANTNLDIGGTLEMVSTQATGDARVNIRSNTTLNVGGDLYMRALRQAKVGHHANITVGETFTIISNGETLSEEDSDWSSIAYDSVINAKRLSVASYEKVSIGARTIVNTDSIYLNALDCKIGATSQINSITKEGNCFSGLHPDARFRTTPIGGGEAPLQLFINGDRSTTPTGNIVAYHWEFVGLGTVTTTIPTTYYTFNEPGTYRIRLQVENSEGLKNTTSRKIIVTGDANQAPTSSFIISDSDILVGESITVDASSSTDDYQIRKYHWILSNGASLTTRDPIANFTFNEIGNVDISLIVEDFFGVKSAVSTQTITVNSDTNGIPASAYFNVDLFPTFTGLDIYNRSIAGDGEIVELYYLVDGIRYDLYDFTYGSRINLQNISHDGDIEVSIFVTDSLGNQSSLTKTFVMNNTVKPIASFELEQSNSLTAYVKAIKSYDPLNDINSISIDWGDGAVESINPTSLYLTHQYLQAGDYNVTLTINTTRGESSSHTKTISIIDGVVPTINPTALFEVQKDPALGHVRVYVSESGTPNGSITGYSWQMGDGNVIEGLDQVAYFYDVGIYPVTLTITDSLGLTSSQTQTIVITENGDPLVISPQCSTNSNTLTADCVTYVAHRFAQFNNLQVDWGDGSVENFSPLNPYASLYDSLAHTYSEAGSYTATFYATAANGDTATVTREFYFDSGNMRPTGYIICNSNGLTVFCNGTGSYDPDGFITHYEFEVAQGNVIFSQDGQLSFTYPQAGTYEISLVAYDQLGLASIPVSTTITIEQVNNPPVAQLNCNSDSAFKVSCDAIGSYDSDGGIYTYEYIFYGDSNESVIRNTDSSFNYYFESAGNKRIDLIVTDDKGTSATTTINVDVLDNIAPIAVFSCSSDAVGELSCDGSNSSDSDGTISQYNWTINGQTYSGQVISVSGISATNVTVQLQVVDNAGATNMSTGSVSMYVNQLPVADFNCVSNNIREINCNSISSDPDGNIVDYEWTIEGSNYTGQSISVALSMGGNQNVILRIVDNNGGEAELTKTVFVTEAIAPTATIVINGSRSITQVTEGEANFANAGNSVAGDGTISSYSWSLDGVLQVSDQNIDLSSLAPGKYELSLVVENSYGISSESVKSLIVASDIVPEILITDIVQYAPKEVSLELVNAGHFVGIDSIEWEYPKEGKIAYGQNGVLELNFLGSQEIIVKVIDINGAVYTATANVIVENNGTYLEGYEFVDIFSGEVTKSSFTLHDRPEPSFTYSITGSPVGVSINDGLLSVDGTTYTSGNDIEINILDENSNIVHSKIVSVRLVSPVKTISLSSSQAADYTFSEPNSVLNNTNISVDGLSERSIVNVKIISQDLNKSELKIDSNNQGLIKLTIPNSEDLLVKTIETVDIQSSNGSTLVDYGIYRSNGVNSIYVESGVSVVIQKLSNGTFSTCNKEAPLATKVFDYSLNGVPMKIDLYGISNSEELEFSNQFSKVQSLINNYPWTSIPASLYVTDKYRNQSFCTKSSGYAFVRSGDVNNQIYVNLPRISLLGDAAGGVLVHELDHLEKFHLFKTASEPAFSIYSLADIDPSTKNVLHAMLESSAQNAVLSSNDLSFDQKKDFVDGIGLFNGYKNSGFVSYGEDVKKGLKNVLAADTVFNIGYIFPFNFDNFFIGAAASRAIYNFSENMFDLYVSNMELYDSNFNKENSLLDMYQSFSMPWGSVLWDILVDDLEEEQVRKSILELLSFGSSSIKNIEVGQYEVELLVYDRKNMEDKCNLTLGEYECEVTPYGRFYVDMEYSMDEDTSISFLGNLPEKFGSISTVSRVISDIATVDGEYKEILQGGENSIGDLDYQPKVIAFVNFGDQNSKINAVMRKKTAKIRNIAVEENEGVVIRADNIFSTGEDSPAEVWFENLDELGVYNQNATITNSIINDFTFIKDTSNYMSYFPSGYDCTDCTITNGPSGGIYPNMKLVSFKNKKLVENARRMYETRIEIKYCGNSVNPFTTIDVIVDPRETEEEVTVVLFDDHCDIATINNGILLCDYSYSEPSSTGVLYSKNYVFESKFRHTGFANNPDGCRYTVTEPQR